MTNAMLLLLHWLSTKAVPAVLLGFVVVHLGITLSHSHAAQGAPLSISLRDDPLRVEETMLTFPVSADPLIRNVSLHMHPIQLTIHNASRQQAHRLVFLNDSQLLMQEVVATARDDTAFAPSSVRGVWISTQLLRAGQSETLYLPPFPPGTYRYVCTVPGHAAAGIQGVLNVIPDEPSTADKAWVYFDILLPLGASVILLGLIGGTVGTRMRFRAHKTNASVETFVSAATTATPEPFRHTPLMKWLGFSLLIVTVSCVVGFVSSVFTSSAFGVFALPFGLSAGCCYAVISGMVFREQLARRFIAVWVSVSVLGMVSGPGLSVVLLNFLGFPLAGVVGGVLLGSSQWIILQRRHPQAHWWIGTITLAWTLVMLIVLQRLSGGCTAC